MGGVQAVESVLSRLRQIFFPRRISDPPFHATQEDNAEMTASISKWTMSPEKYVNTLYHLLLGRGPDEEGFRANVADLYESADPTRTLAGFINSPEGRTHLNLLFGSSDWISEVNRNDISPDFAFNEMLHELRTQELLNTTGTDGTMVSIGCSNAAYFEWIHDTLGKPREHLGLEYYSPMPDVLPDNVTWIANTAANMSDVPNRSVDLIFGGQVVEHLWADELANFFHECTRVLKPGGRLIFDTPNERVTRHARWKHAEHTTELRPDDAQILLKSLGFTVEKLAGHWLVEGSRGWLRLNRITEEGPYSKQQRIEEGRSAPERSFSWWVEARYDGSVEPDRDLTRLLVRNMWMRYGHHQFNRTTRTDGELVTQREPGLHGRFVHVEEGWTGNLLQSAHNATPPGKIRVGVELEPYDFEKSPGLLEIVHRPSGRVIAQRDLPSEFDGGRFFVEGEVPQTLFSVEFNLRVTNGGPMTARMSFLVSASVWSGETWDLYEGLLPE